MKRLPKGNDTTGLVQARHLAALNALLAGFCWERLSRCRLASHVVYLGDAEVGVGVKVVTYALQKKYGQFIFNLSADVLRNCLYLDLAVLLVGVDATGNVPLAAYLLHGPEDLATLGGLQFQKVGTILDPKRQIDSQLQTVLRGYRFDLRVPEGAARLQERLEAILRRGSLRSFHTLVNDDDMVPSRAYRVSRDSYLQTCGAMDKLGVEVTNRRDVVGSDRVDFLVRMGSSTARVQDAVAGLRKCDRVAPIYIFNFCQHGQQQYSCNEFELLQVSLCDGGVPTDVVYAIPTRGDTPLTSDDLGKGSTRLSKAWRARFAPFECNLSTDEGRRKYKELCSRAVGEPLTT